MTFHAYKNLADLDGKTAPSQCRWSIIAHQHEKPHEHWNHLNRLQNWTHGIKICTRKYRNIYSTVTQYMSIMTFKNGPQRNFSMALHRSPFRNHPDIRSSSMAQKIPSLRSFSFPQTVHLFAGIQSLRRWSQCLLGREEISRVTSISTT